jgi:hypothetical protein
LKHLLFTFLFSVLFFLNSNAQVVDESINGVQVGFLGVWLHNESKITPNWAFRSEIGFETPLIAQETQFNDGQTAFNLFFPVLTFSPRWYYNSPKRQGNSKNWFHNSSNFATAEIRYYPKFLAISNNQNVKKDGGLFIIPGWGIRRNLSYRLNYELGFGMGVDISELFKIEDTDLIYNIHLRFGYKFGEQAFQTSK